MEFSPPSSASRFDERYGWRDRTKHADEPNRHRQRLKVDVWRLDITEYRQLDVIRRTSQDLPADVRGGHRRRVIVRNKTPAFCISPALLKPEGGELAAA